VRDEWLYPLDDLLQVASISLSIFVRNRSNLVVVSQAQDAADLDLIGADLALCCIVEVGDITVNVRLIDGYSVLGSVRLQYDVEVALRLEAQITSYNLDEISMKRSVVFILDGTQIGIGST
jgi:hypothetical protein